MSTHSSIAARCHDGKVRSIYCHSDGDPPHNGRILSEHFRDQQKIEDMLALGDMSVLAPSIECPEGHAFKYENRVEGHSVFYGRDRGEDNVDCLVCDSYEDCLRENKHVYNYFWDGEEWFVNGKILSEILV